MKQPTQAPTAVLATIEQNIAALERTTGELIALLPQETAAVRASDLISFAAMKEKKQILFERYQAEMSAILSRKNELKALPEPVKQRIRGWEDKLRPATRENITAHERASATFSRLRERIVTIAKESVQRAGASYGSNGSLQINTKRVISTSVQDQA